MKRFVKKYFMIICASVILVTGCEKKKNVIDYYDNSDNIQIDVSSEILSFDIVLLTTNKVSDVSFLTCNGENIDTSKINVSLINNSLESYANLKKEGLYCSDWLIDIEFLEEGYYKIDNMTLNVDGTEKVLEFKHPIEYTKAGGNDIINEEFYCTSFPCEFPSSMIGTEETIQYEFMTDVDCTFKGLNVKNFFDLSDAVYYVNDVSKKQELPIALKKGDKVFVKLNYKKHKEAINQYSYLITNMEVNYELDGNEIVRNGAIVFNPVSPMDEKNKKLDKFVDNVLKNKE